MPAMAGTYIAIMYMDSDNFNIIAWNVREGVGVRAKRRLRDLIQTYRPSLMAVCETHCKFDRVIVFWQQQGFELIHEVEARGHSGGIWILVPRQRTFVVTLLEEHEQALSVEITSNGR